MSLSGLLNNCSSDAIFFGKVVASLSVSSRLGFQQLQNKETELGKILPSEV
jgi:hypothetical protein